MIRVLQGDCRDVLPTLEAGSVHCVVCSPPYYALRSYLDASHHDKHREIGSEATPDEYIQTMVAVFREVRRVLRNDGTCWVNMGDSYTTHGGYTASAPSNAAGSKQSTNAGTPRAHGALPGHREKNLLMMPARLALALQADGWWIRSDIIWAKPNPMPESVTDRCVSAHEHIFMLTKAPRYYFDAQAIAEPAINAGRVVSYDGTQKNTAHENPTYPGAKPRDIEIGATRSCRNVWTIATAPFSEAHFATFPPELAERCIKAGTSERGCCAQCGAPWVRQIDTTYLETDETRKHSRGKPGIGAFMASGAGNKSGGWNDYPNLAKQSTTTGWSPSCQCDAPTQPCTVLDPFAGAGTTMLVADRLQRDSIGIELNEAYAVMARNRIVADAPLFAEVAD